MSNENTPVSDVEDDLDAFAADFFGQKEAQPEPASSEEDQTDEDTHEDAPTDDTHVDEEDTLADEDGSDEPEDKPKPKKNRFQERIDELTNARREAERKAAALEERLSKLEQNGKTEPTKEVEDTGPTPADQNEDGTDKYPLGEFDPNYIRDLTRHALQQERRALQEQEKQEQAQREADKELSELQAGWQEKLGPAQERYPDFREKGEQLLGTFESIDQSYGEYLTATLMSMDFGPDVLYYLANNVDEAQKIVASGPTKATIALGRLEAKFAAANEEKQQARPKVSQAPTPPERLNKGAAPVKIEIPDDTDDLDAFSKKFFKKK